MFQEALCSYFHNLRNIKFPSYSIFEYPLGIDHFKEMQVHILALLFLNAGNLNIFNHKQGLLSFYSNKSSIHQKYQPLMQGCYNTSIMDSWLSQQNTLKELDIQHFRSYLKRMRSDNQLNVNIPNYLSRRPIISS